MDNCIMRYRVEDAVFYEKADGPWAWRKSPGEGNWVRGDYLPKYVNPPRTVFCTQKEGTGINDPKRPGGPLAGDATRGDCLHRLHVNDHQPPPLRDFLETP